MAPGSEASCTWTQCPRRERSGTPFLASTPTARSGSGCRSGCPTKRDTEFCATTSPDCGPSITASLDLARCPTQVSGIAPKPLDLAAHGPVRIDRDVRRLVDDEVVARPLADEPEVVDVRVGGRPVRQVRDVGRTADGVVQVTGCQPDAMDARRLAVIDDVEPSARIFRGAE